MCNSNKNLLLLAFALLASTLSQLASAAAPAGQWWDFNYTQRRQISIPVVGPANLAAGYSLRVTFNHAAEVTAGRSLANGNDVRLVHWNGTTWTEYDRVVDPQSTWNSATTQIWFDIPTQIAGDFTDDNFYFYFGNTSPATPLANADLIFLLYDDFGGASIANAKWGTNGTVTQTGGVITVSGNGSYLRADDGLGVDTIWETRASLSAATTTGFNYWGTSSAATFTGSYLYFQTNSPNHRANVQGTTTNITVPTPTSYQNYAFARQGAGVAHFWVNGAINATPNATFLSGAPAGTLRALMRTDAAGLTASYDYVRIRQYRNAEPIVTLSGTLVDAPVIAWYMGEPSWSGAANEVVESGGYGLPGRAFGGATTAGGLTGCRYGTFNGTNQYVEVPDNAAFDRTTQLSVSVWIYPRAYGTELKSIVSKDDNYEFHLNASGQVYWWWNGGGTREITSTGTPVPLNQWTHVAITYESGVQRLYINGVVRGTNNRAEVLPTNNLALQIGYDGAGSAQAGRYWNGYIDSVQIYANALTGAQVIAAMNATQPCAVAHHLTITHDGFGIHCLAEPITVFPRDIANNPVAAYTELVTLNTGTASGDWSLQTGTGTLTNGTANDGIATYQWVSGETSATFLLTYRQGTATFNITASSATITDDNTEGTMTFSPNGFIVTSSALTNPPPVTIPAFATPQIAGTAFNAYITAYGTTPTDTQCGVIESYTGAHSLKFWPTYVNPNSGTRGLIVNGVTSATSEPASTAQSITFTSGQTAALPVTYKDVGLIAISVKDDTTINATLPTGIRGSSSNFVVKPSTFSMAIRRTDNNVANPAATSDTGAIFIPAGQAFTVVVTSLDSTGATTPNFGIETPAETVQLPATLVLPVGGLIPALAGGFTASGGVLTGTTFSWGEVGIINVTPRLGDGSYLGAGDVVGPAANVGRFIPYNFGVTQNSPVIAPACVASGYVYMGQPLTYSTVPVLSLTARALGGTRTQNYQGAFFKLTNTSSTGRNYVSSSGTLDQTGLPANDPAVTQLGLGLAALTFSSSSGIFYTRTTPVAPFTPTLTLSLNILDTDGVAASTNVNVLSTNPWTLNAPSISSPEQRYGRVAFRNAVGSELLGLPLPMRAEYFLNTTAGFVLNTNDTCTTGITLAFGTYGGNLNSGETCLINDGTPGVGGVWCAAGGLASQQFKMPPVATSPGDFVATLRAPGANNDGTVTLTTVVPSWLRFDWNAAVPGLENPSGIATFGIFKGDAKRIFQTEK